MRDTLICSNYFEFDARQTAKNIFQQSTSASNFEEPLSSPVKDDLSDLSHQVSLTHQTRITKLMEN
ncbi:hypothetical protein CHS0354_038083, partial [Potamilus streckersoni]